MRISRFEFSSLAAALAATSVLALACGSEEAPSAPSAAAPSGGSEAAAPASAQAPTPASLAERAKAIFGVLPEDAASEANPSTSERVALGKTLYWDPRLSKNHDISCNSCHRIDSFGVDHEPTSPGHKGQRGGRNSPTSFNAAFHAAQFWDGRSPDVEDQAKGPVLNPIEMAMPDAASVEGVLRSIPAYGPMFAAAFPGEESPLSFDNMALAIAAFERKLVTPGAFDAFQKGDTTALNETALRGLALFMDSGCTTCHNGANLGGRMFQKLGLVNAYPTADTGRMEVTGNESDRHVFKVPSLRNVAETYPYFHDGSVETLEEAIRLMAYHQLGKDLDDSQVADIGEFLRALTGQLPPGVAAVPELPASGQETPEPDPS